MMKTFKLVLTLLIGFVLFVSFGTGTSADTGVRYATYTTSNNELVRTQTAYIALSSMDEIYGVSLDVPKDLFIGQNNNVYIVSSNSGGTAGKIIRFNLSTEDVLVIGEDFLLDPTGIFVDDDDTIYVADRAGQVVYKLTQDGTILQEFTRPDSPLYGDDQFNPRKVVVDLRGNVYVLNNGSRGLMQYTRDGEFLGYFGTNTIQPSLRMVLQYIFYTDEQLDNTFTGGPPEISNVAIDDRGLIHTSSLGVAGFGIKRLNISGANRLPELYNEPDLVDLYVGPIGNIYAISASGIIAEYDIEGNLLFLFGEQDTSEQIKGLFNIPSAIAVDDRYNIYVLDSAAQELQIFIPTEFATLVHEALALYQDGRYIESREPWEAVLKQNDLFDLAHTGLGNAYFSLEDYELAMAEYYISYNRAGYSEAFWEVRNAWLLENIGTLLVFVFVFMFGYLINLRWRYTHHVMRPIKRGLQALRNKVRVLDEILFVFRYLRNPADATYDIKRQNRVGMISAAVLLLIYFGLYVFYIYRLAFLFNFRVLANINLLEELLTVFLPIVLFVIANYLIGSIREGEGRLRDVFVTTVFSLSPFFLALPVLVGMSHVLTYNEAFLMDFLLYIAIGVTVIYFFFMVKETHYYGVKDTVASIGISFFTMVMMLLGSFIVYILLSELVNLVINVVMEVFYRV